MQKLEQRIHICEISSFCHWLKPATLVAADCESQAWRKQRKPIQNLEYLWCLEGQHQSRRRRKVEELPGSPAGISPPSFRRIFVSSAFLRELCQLWILSIDGRVFPGEQTLLPTLGRAQEMSSVLMTQKRVWVCSLLLPQLFPVLPSPPDS